MEDSELKEIYLVLDHCKDGEIMSQKFWKKYFIRKDWREDRKLTEEESKEIFYQLAKALDYSNIYIKIISS